MKATDACAESSHLRCAPLLMGSSLGPRSFTKARYDRPGGIIALLSVITCCCVSAGGGSIFDDDWVPPKPAVSRPAPTQAPPAVPPAASEPKTTAPPALNPGAQPSAPGSKTPAPPAPKPAARRAIPGKSEQARSRALLKSTFADQLKDRSIAGRRKLAQALLEAVPRIADNASDEYVLLGGAIDASKEAGILSLCASAADEMSSQYDVDALNIKIDAALKMDLRGDSPASSAENVQIVLQLADSLAAEENFVVAAKLLTSARRAAQQDSASRVQRQIQIVEFLRAAHDRAAPSVDKLRASPEDPAANLAVGSYLCFARSDWQKGLPMLARGSDANLKHVALTELSHPQSNDDMIAVADRWWDVAASQPEISRNVIRQHAAACYKSALPAASGLARLHLERRIADASAAESAPAQAGKSPTASGAGPAKTPGTAKASGDKGSTIAKGGVAAKGVEFLADKSASLRPVGTQEHSKTRQFPKQQSDDALDPFSGRPVYFGLHSHDIWYAVNAPVDIRQVYWRGASFKNMTIAAVDDSGTTLREIGPFTSGDDAYQYTLDLPPTRHSRLHIHAENRHWIMIEAIELRTQGKPTINGPVPAAK